MPRPAKRLARSRVIAVEVPASGAADFDGNDTNDVQSWLVADKDWKDENCEDMFLELMRHTVSGHLAWVVFPPQGYRIDTGTPVRDTRIVTTT